MENTTDIVVKKLEQNPDVKSLQTIVPQRIAFAQALIIKNDEDEKLAAEMLLATKDDFKKTEAVRRFCVDPYNGWVKAINARFAKLSDPLDGAIKTISMKLVLWQNEKRKKADAAQERIMKQVETGKIDADKAVEKLANIKEPEKTVKAESASVTYRTDLKVTIVDSNLVPREYCSPDPAKFKTVAFAFHKTKQQQIPGIQVEEIKTPVSSRTY